MSVTGAAWPWERTSERATAFHATARAERLASRPAARAGDPPFTTIAWRLWHLIGCYGGDIIVPANPLSAQGLATPYQLTGPGGMTPAQSGCEMSNGARLGAFVQATILDPATGALSVYEPLVITKGTRPDTPGMKLRPPVIPADAVVTIDFGLTALT